MKNINLFVLILLSAFFFTSCKKSEVAPDNSNPANSNSTAGVTGNELNAQKMLDLVNEQRAKGCTCGTTVMPAVNALKWNTKLEQAAYSHSLDMKTRSFFSHDTPEGKTPWERIKAQGYTYSSAAENIASGQTTEESVMKSWMASEGHCKNIMGVAYTEMGAGRSGNLWTQVFAKP